MAELQTNQKLQEEKEKETSYYWKGWLPPKLAFLLVSFSLGELGDGLNIFQGIYLVGIGWNEGHVGIALSLMGLTALIVQPFAGDWVDKTRLDRRLFLGAASILTALSASAILLVSDNGGGNTFDRSLIFISKVIEGISASFIGPCLAALTLASFGPHHFDAVMASNIFWGHAGSVAAAVLAGWVAYGWYPNVQYCFLVIGAAALLAVMFVPHLPQGDPLMGRGFEGHTAIDEQGHVETLINDDDETTTENEQPPQAASYVETFCNKKIAILCLTGFFFHFANANVLLVLGELMGQDDDGVTKRSAIPLVAGAICVAQFTMCVATYIGNYATNRGVGRKPLFMTGLLTLPVRCALIIYVRNMGDSWLLSTQLLDGLGGGLFGLIHPFLVADLAYGTGRFNVIMGLTASFFGMGATLSNFFGQFIVEHFGHVVSLSGSLVLSFVPIVLFLFMPETMGHREKKHDNAASAYKPIV